MCREVASNRVHGLIRFSTSLRLVYDLSVIESEPSVLESVDEFKIVSRNKQRHTNFVETLEKTHDVEGEIRIEIAGWLISNDQLWSAGDGPGNSNTLLLSGG